MTSTSINQCVRKFIEFAEAEYPREACGMIAGLDQALQWFPCRNIQDEMNRQDPKSFPRSSKEAFWMDPADLAAVQKQMRQCGGTIRFICHSHIDAAAYFSETDQRYAVFEQSAVYPGVRHLVLSVHLGKAGDYKVFEWQEQSKRFVETTL